MRHLLLVLATFFMPQAVCAATVEGLSVSDVEALLGRPFEITESVWRYHTPLKETVEIYFVSGRATVVPPIAQHVHSATYRSGRELRKHAKELLAAGATHDAAFALSKCAAIAPADSACREMFQRVTKAYQQEILEQQRMAQTPEAGLELTYEVREVFPNYKRAGEADASYRSIIQQRKDPALIAIAAEHRQQLTTLAIATARERFRENSFGAAAAELQPFEDQIDAQMALAEMREDVGKVVGARLRMALSQRTVSELNGVAFILQSAGSLAPADVRVTTAELTEILPPKLRGMTTTAYGRRVLREALHNSGHDALAAMPEIGTARAAVAIQNSGSSSCSPDVTSHIESSLQQAVADQGDPFVTVRVVESGCQVSEGNTAEVPVQSTYLSGYTQLVNSEYVRLQQELAEAEVELEQTKASAAKGATSNFGAVLGGLAVGLASSRVSKLRKALASTEPYINQPIHLQYTATRFTRAKRANIFLRMSSDATVETVEGSAERTGSGLYNVLPGDAQNLSNSSPGLGSDGEVLRAAFDDASARAVAAARRIAARALLQNGLSASTSIERVGHALLAFDLSPETVAAVVDFDPQTLTFERLQSLPNLIPAKPAALTTTTKVSSQPSSATKSLKKALASTVVIETSDGVGSGFVVSDVGHVLTNEHVIAGADRVRVRVPDGGTFLGRVIASSRLKDLALLEIQTSNLAPLSISASMPDVGEDVYAIGSPRGLDQTVTRGIVSATRAIEGTQYLQIDAAINPGNSGGPVIDREGMVVGVATSKRRGTEGMGFAVGCVELNEFIAIAITNPQRNSRSRVELP